MLLPTGSRLQRRRQFFKRLRLYAYISGIFLLIISAAYLITRSSFFKLGEIKIVSTEPINESLLLATLRTQVAARPIAAWLGADSYFAWPLDLRYAAPNIATISIEKSFWAKIITITVIPRDRYAVWCGQEGSCAWVDTDGILFQPAPVAEGQLVQTIFDTGVHSLGMIGDPVLSSSSFGVVKKTIDGVKRMNIGVSRIAVDGELQELQLTTNTGALIRMSLRFDPSVTALPAIGRFAEKPGFSKIEYLNLTVENRAYVKYR